MLFRFRVYIKSWATLIQFPKLLAQVVTLTNFSKVHFKTALKKIVSDGGENSKNNGFHEYEVISTIHLL